MLRKATLIAAALCLSACATPQTPAQTVYVMETDFAAALAVAGAYHDLPVCPATPLCKDPTTLVRIQAASLAAGAALGTAQTAVRGGGNATTAILTAQGAIVALQDLTNALQVK